MPRQSKNQPVFHSPKVPVPVHHHVVAPTFGQTLKDSFGMGIGISLGQRAVNAVFGAATPAAPVAQKPVNKCQKLNDSLNNCILNMDDVTSCVSESMAYKNCMLEN
jgi:hypothetical protein